MADTQNSTYVFTTDALKEAVRRLVSQPIHEHFMGYLAILRSRRITGVDEVTSSDVTSFFHRYLELPGDKKSPYVSPFRSRNYGSLVRINKNPAGSYSPASIRQGRPLFAVLDIGGTPGHSTYTLKPNHYALASEALLRGQKVPVGALAAFIYRDYGLELESRDVTRVVALFRDEFGLRPSVADEANGYSLLFHDDLGEMGPSDLIEPESEAS